MATLDFKTELVEYEKHLRTLQAGRASALDKERMISDALQKRGEYFKKLLELESASGQICYIDTAKDVFSKFALYYVEVLNGLISKINYIIPDLSPSEFAQIGELIEETKAILSEYQVELSFDPVYVVHKRSMKGVKTDTEVEEND